MNEQGASVERLLTEADRIIGEKKSVSAISSAINLKCIEQGLNLDLRGTPPPTCHNSTPSQYKFLPQWKTQIQSSYLSSFAIWHEKAV
jgi:hypothetical protein